MESGNGTNPPLPINPLRFARLSVCLLLAINLFNYIDRNILAAVQDPIHSDFLSRGMNVSHAQMGFLSLAFMASYMLLSPLFGFLADRYARWALIGIGVILWSLASGASGLATTYTMMLITRCFVGVGEAAYGPVAPTIISDLYPIQRRGQVLAWFYMAIPVGSALGYILGGAVNAHFGWRMAFYVVVPPGILLGILSFFMPNPPRGASDGAPVEGGSKHAPSWRDIRALLNIKSYLYDTLGMTAMTFAIGGIAFWMPAYIARVRMHINPDVDRTAYQNINLIFGGLTAASGVIATLAGGYVGDALRKRFSGAYFLVSGAGLFISFLMVLVLLVTPFPAAWAVIFLAEFFLFFNTGPSNAILANVTHPSIRASAFALNILIIHAFGDAISPYLIGAIADRYGMQPAFAIVCILMAAGAGFWLWGAKYLAEDEARIQSTDTASPAVA